MTYPPGGLHDLLLLIVIWAVGSEALQVTAAVRIRGEAPGENLILAAGLPESVRLRVRGNEGGCAAWEDPWVCGSGAYATGGSFTTVQKLSGSAPQPVSGGSVAIGPIPVLLQ